MRTIARDYTISIKVPDDILPEDCEIVILSISASYTDRKGISISKSETEVSIYPEDPYEM